MAVTKQERFRADSGVYRQLAHPVFMAVSPARFLPGKSGRKGCSDRSRTPPPSRGPLPIACPHQPHPHSSWLRGIKGHTACVGRQRARPGGRRRREGLPIYRTQRRLRTETPRPQELEHLLQDPQGVHSPGPYLRAERRVSQKESWGPPSTFLCASRAPSPPYLSSTPQITAQEGPQQEQKIPEEAGSEGAQKSQEAVISGTRVGCHLSPGWLCDPGWRLNLSGLSCL